MGRGKTNIKNRIYCTGQQLEEPDSPWLHYLLLRAVNKFHTENGSHPGYYDDNVETDIAKLKVIISSDKLLSDISSFIQMTITV